jgi:hypothetical protein
MRGLYRMDRGWKNMCYKGWIVAGGERRKEREGERKETIGKDIDKEKARRRKLRNEGRKGRA